MLQLLTSFYLLGSSLNLLPGKVCSRRVPGKMIGNEKKFYEG